MGGAKKGEKGGGDGEVVDVEFNFNSSSSFSSSLSPTSTSRSPSYLSRIQLSTISPLVFYQLASMSNQSSSSGGKDPENEKVSFDPPSSSSLLFPLPFTFRPPSS